jgi:uncharacterized membrane protein YhhN
MRFTWLFFLAVAFALIDWYAAWKENRKLLIVAKPATLLFLILWSLQLTSWYGVMFWFGLGLIFSLAGDVFLLFSARWFLAGLGAFLLAHLAFIVGFNIPLPKASLFSMLMAVFVAIIAVQTLKHILPGVRRLPSRRVMEPATIAYGSALTLMFLSTLITLFSNTWLPEAALFAALGGGFFFISDSTLSYDRFVKKLPHGRFWVHITYHLGVAGILIGAMINYLH